MMREENIYMRKYLLSERSTFVINVCWLMSAMVIVKTKFSWWSHDLMHERAEERRSENT